MWSPHHGCHTYSSCSTKLLKAICLVMGRTRASLLVPPRMPIPLAARYDIPRPRQPDSIQPTGPTSRPGPMRLVVGRAEMDLVRWGH